MPATCWAISSVAFAVWSASDLTSCATTAKPVPASPARAASIVALSASRLVCAAIAVIRSTTSPMRCAAARRGLRSRRPRIRSSSRPARTTRWSPARPGARSPGSRRTSSSDAAAMSLHVARGVVGRGRRRVRSGRPPVRRDAGQGLRGRAHRVGDSARPRRALVLAPRRGTISTAPRSARCARRAPSPRRRRSGCSSALRRIASWNTPIERASAPTSSCRSHIRESRPRPRRPRPPRSRA